MKTIKRILFVSVALTFLLQSCSTGHKFSKKRYGHLNWIDHDTKVETVGKDATFDAPTTINSNKKSDEISPLKVQEEKQIQQPANVPSETQPVFETMEKTHRSTSSANTGKDDFVVIETENGNESTTVAEPVIPVQPHAVKSVKNTKEGSTGELLLMAVLIALAIILFFWLDSALGGILTLILIIFIILILLRYFGVI